MSYLMWSERIDCTDGAFNINVMSDGVFEVSIKKGATALTVTVDVDDMEKLLPQLFNQTKAFRHKQLTEWRQYCAKMEAQAQKEKP
jgi:hypothetical protein